MTFSVIIPTKNEERYLPTLLTMVKAQDTQPLEIIVADAGSTDSTRHIAESYGAKVVDGGLPSVGRNRGAEAARGELFFFLDADVLLPDHFFSRVIEEMETRHLDMGTPDVEMINGTRVDRFFASFYNSYVRWWGTRRPHAAGFCIVVRRALHQKIGGFNEAVLFAEDQEYAQRANTAGAFNFLDSVTVGTPARRQERDGRLRMAVTYVLAELHMLLLGPIRHNGFRYSFGYDHLHRKKNKIVGHE